MEPLDPGDSRGRKATPELQVPKEHQEKPERPVLQALQAKRA